MADDGFQGADTAAMADLSGLIENGARALDAVLSTVDDLLRRIEGGCWTGPDADAFAASTQQTGERIGLLREDLGARGEEVGRHGREQDEASAPDADGGGGIPAAGPTGSAEAFAAAGAATAGAATAQRAGGASTAAAPSIPSAPQMMVMDDGTMRRVDEGLRGLGLPGLPVVPAGSASREESLAEAVRL